MNRHLRRRLGLGLAVLLLAACSDEGDPTSPGGSNPDPDPQTLDFASDVQSIFTANCGPACHGAAGNGGLDLRPGQSHGQLVGVDSPTYGAPRVAPGNPDGSVLFDKISGGGTYGGAMPQGTSGLGAADQAVIRAWILAGAPDGTFPAPANSSALPSPSPGVSR